MEFFPNWRYALLATIAGIFYGSTWAQNRQHFPRAIVRALVDTTGSCCSARYDCRDEKARRVQRKNQIFGNTHQILKRR